MKNRYSTEFRLKAVKLREQGNSLKRIATELGMRDTKQIRKWIGRFKEEGEEGLKDRVPKMKEATMQRRAETKELEGLRTENALLKYLLKIKKKDDTKGLKR